MPQDLNNIEYIEPEDLNNIVYIIRNLNYEQFLKDLKTQDAVVRNFVIIGEAVKFLPDDLKNRTELILWNKIAGIRDRLIHQYFGVNYEIMWTIIDEELTDFQIEIDKILLDLRIYNNLHFIFLLEPIVSYYKIITLKVKLYIFFFNNNC